MISDYQYEDYFADGDHVKQILIVPQRTQVIPKKDREPTIKVWNEQTNTYVAPAPATSIPLKFKITNRNIVKEQFSITESINSPDDLAFGSCEPGQVKFTIRNERYKDETTGEILDIIPALTGCERNDSNEIVSFQEIVKVYMYFDDDSSTLLYIGMYKVQEDKLSTDGKSRDILAYDYLYELRDMDISEWYKNLFAGLTTHTNTEEEEEEDNDSDNSDENSSNSNSENQNEGSNEEKEEGGVEIRPKQDKWTIYDALLDLFKNLTMSNGKDNYYPGYGMKMWFDEEIINENSETFPIINSFEFVKNNNYIDKSYSCGKFFEDIGVLLGAYPKIMRGVPGAQGWCKALGGDKELSYDNATKDGKEKTTVNWHLEDYCVLTFVSLEKSNVKIKKHDVIREYKMLKGITSEAYEISSINLLRAFNSNGKVITYYSGGLLNTDLIHAYNKNKTKKMEELYGAENKKKGVVAITSYDITGNLFLSQYGVKFKKGDTEEQISISENKKEIRKVLKKAFQNINERVYKPYKVECPANLCRETGDRVRFVNNFDELYASDFKSYILERKISGIQKMIDTYSAKGSNGLPNFGNYKSGTSYSESGMTGALVTSTPTPPKTNEKTDDKGNVVDTDFTSSDFVEIIRNVGMRLLDEPNVTKCVYSPSKKKVYMRWEDPDDITDYSPLPAEWVGTIVVRKEGSPPIHRWDGTVLVDSTVRDQYKSTSFVDTTAEADKDYYYGFFPYHLADNDIYQHDPNHPIYWYRFTKVMHVETGEIATPPVINSAEINEDLNANVTCNVVQTYGASEVYLVMQAGAEPISIDDGTPVRITQTGEQVITIPNVDESTDYFFKIFVVGDGDETESNVAEAISGTRTSKVIFRPNFNSDGRDTIRYDENNSFYLESSYFQVEPFHTGQMKDSNLLFYGDDYYDDPDHEYSPNIVSNGVLTMGDKGQVVWLFDTFTHPLKVGYSKYNLTISLDFKGPTSALKGPLINMSTWMESYNSEIYDPETGEYDWKMILNPDGDTYPIIYGPQAYELTEWGCGYAPYDDDGYYYALELYDSEHPIINSLDPDTWHNLKYVIEIYDDRVNAVYYYVDGELYKGFYNLIRIDNYVYVDMNDLARITLCAETGTQIKNLIITADNVMPSPIKDFVYTGEIEQYIIPQTGWYKLQTWGASGQTAVGETVEARGGYGSYSEGYTYLTAGTVINVCVGGQNGYNGGGTNE